MSTKSIKIPFEPEPDTFPVLMEYDGADDNNYIVLFTSRKTGTVVWVGDKHTNSDINFGMWSDTWFKDAFEPFDGFIKLGNKL